MSEPEITVRRNDERSSYEILVNGEVAGYTTFVPDGDVVVFPHTVVDPKFSGMGLGSKLVGEALADEAARGETVKPVCPFVVKYLEKHEVPGLKIAASPEA